MRPALSFRPAAGFSIVELMVAMVIALVATIVIFQTFAVSEGIKRTSTSGGDAQQNGALALYAMSRELRMAGYGINNTGLLGCTLHAYDALRGSDVKDDNNKDLTLAPVVIEPAAAPTDPDSVSVIYGNARLLSNPAQLTQNMAGPTTLYRVSNRYGYSAGDLVVVVEPGKLDGVTGQPACALAEITAAPDIAGQTDELNHDLGTYLNAANENTNVRFNKAGGPGVTYTTDAHVYDLGTQPPQKRYKIVNNQLVVDSFFGPAGSTVVADNIVQLRVEYGKDTDNDNIVDTYDAAAPANWQQVLAVHLAVVARSALAEKPTVVGGACDATTALPTWSGGTLDVSADPNWNCYKYRVFETTIPLRNLIWQQL